MEAVASKWNAVYSQADPACYPVAQVLTDNEFLLPQAGTALDLACGLGANAVFFGKARVGGDCLGYFGRRYR